MNFRTCKQCKEELELNDRNFYRQGAPYRHCFLYICKQCKSDYNAKYRIKHTRRYREYQKKYRNTDRYRKLNSEYQKKYTQRPERNIHRRMAVAIGLALKGKKAGRSWEKLVGYSLDELMSHLESGFKPGMNWNNKELWHIDHIIPISAWRPEEFKKCWALENLQPLWAEENLRKGNRV